jgi:hypothetical protein
MTAQTLCGVAVGVSENTPPIYKTIKADQTIRLG